ncbi:MAG: hypothetical protein P1U42_10265, partial [Phycisphaerales bacterium]|nr:hypothetical protein [Phycisphaerales bacterium]
MIEANTLFILGAGASADYGLPLGVGLTKEIVDFLHAHQETFYDEFIGSEHDENGFSKLARIIQNSRSPTIDAFIRDNDKYSELLKAAIAGVLLRHENHVLSDEKFPPRDWLAWMFHVKMASRPES